MIYKSFYLNIIKKKSVVKVGKGREHVRNVSKPLKTSSEGQVIFNTWSCVCKPLVKPN